MLHIACYTVIINLIILYQLCKNVLLFVSRFSIGLFLLEYIKGFKL